MNLFILIKHYRWTLSYILTVLVINCLFSLVPPVSLFGINIMGGDFFVGCIYVVRDFAQREIEHKVIFAMIIGAFLSYILADKEVAIASMGAFLIGETVDWLVYTFTKKPLSQRIVLSSCISAPIDSVIFLYLLGMLTWTDSVAITLAKFVGIAALVIIWKSRNPEAKQIQTPSVSPLPLL